jgi:hypothetical protein
MRRHECVVRVVGISGSVADDTVAVIWPLKYGRSLKQRRGIRGPA